MIVGRWFITPHAVEQFQRRFGGSFQYNIALSELIKLTSEAHFVKDIHDRVELWRTGKPHRLRLIVSRRMPGMKQLVTVLKGSNRC